MISCTEFVPAFNEFFKVLESHGGRDAITHFCDQLSCDELADLVKKHGIRGCWLYWEQSLNGEAADFLMEMDEESQEYWITMRWCPSKGRLLEYDHMSVYHDYCRHCDILYRKAVEPLGYDYHADLSECDKAKCSFYIKKKGLQNAK